MAWREARREEPIIHGTRITVGDTFDYLAGGMSPSDIAADFPDLHDEDVRATLAFAAYRSVASLIRYDPAVR